jgi:outer membrane protein assembly factor BamA
VQVGGAFGLSREFADRVVGALQYEQKLIMAAQDTMLFNIRTSFSKDKRDDVFDPQDGGFFLTSAEQVFVQHAKNFFRTTADARWYRPITRRMTFAVRIYGGSIRGESIPLPEKFFAGGASSVRGWGLQELGPGYAGVSGRFHPVGGKHKVEGSAELRWHLPKRMGAAAFIDFGNVGNTLSTYDFSIFAYTVGGGLRYNSPIGPIRLDVGFKVKDPFNSDFYGLRPYNIHFSLGQAF